MRTWVEEGMGVESYMLQLTADLDWRDARLQSCRDDLRSGACKG